MSGGQIIGGVFGAVAGYFIPGGGAAMAMRGMSLGMAIGGYLDPPKEPVIQGPRLEDLTVQTATYGSIIPRVYGTVGITGNIFWVENNTLKEVETRSQSGGGKGGGGGAETSTFSYYATFAIGLCKGPISGVRRIWISGKLIYDAGSYDLQAIIESNSAQAGFTIYKGAGDQPADPRMQATLGVANTPAYRGLAYIVFKDLALKPYNNTIQGAQVKVEVVKNSTSQQYTTTREEPFTVPSSNSSFSPIPAYIDLERVIFYVPQWINNYPTSSSFIKHDIVLSNGVPKTVIACPGTTVQPNLFTTDKSKYLYSANQIFTFSGFGMAQGKIYEHGGVYIGLSDYNPSWSLVKTLYVSTGSPASQRTFTANSDDHSIAFDGTYIYLIGTTSTRKLNLNFGIVSTGLGVSGNFVSARAYCSTDGYIYCVDRMQLNGKLYRITKDLSSISLIKSNIGVYDSGGYSNFIVEKNIAIFASPKYDSRLLQVITISLTEVITPLTQLLSDILQQECLLSKVLSASDIDVSEITKEIRGYRIASISAVKSSLIQLQGACPFDVVQIGYKMKFKPRGSESVVTIPASDLGAVGESI